MVRSRRGYDLLLLFLTERTVERGGEFFGKREYGQRQGVQIRMVGGLNMVDRIFMKGKGGVKPDSSPGALIHDGFDFKNDRFVCLLQPGLQETSAVSPAPEVRMDGVMLNVEKIIVLPESDTSQESSGGGPHLDGVFFALHDLALILQRSFFFTGERVVVDVPKFVKSRMGPGINNYFFNMHSFQNIPEPTLTQRRCKKSDALVRAHRGRARRVVPVFAVPGSGCQNSFGNAKKYQAGLRYGLIVFFLQQLVHQLIQFKKSIGFSEKAVHAGFF